MKILKWFLVIIGIAALAGVRVFENELFYDPFLEFFRGNFKSSKLPDFQWDKLIFSHIFRFGINMLISGFIVHFIFLKLKWTLQSMLLIFIAFLIFFPIYLFCIYTGFKTGFLFAFYARRFVIHPVVLLLIIPLFYYKKHRENSM